MSTRMLIAAWLGAITVAQAQPIEVKLPRAPQTPQLLIAAQKALATQGLVLAEISPRLGMQVALEFDSGSLNAAEKATLASKNGNPLTIANLYMVLLDAKGAGCIASAVEFLTPRGKSVLDGIENTRCAPTAHEFKRLLRVVPVAMDSTE